MFIDPKTASKVIFITGDVCKGSPNDLRLSEIIGEDWKLKTGVDQVTIPYCSPGYNHQEYWNTVKNRMQSFECE